MAEVPVTQQELEEIVFKIARDLIEEAAIEGRIEEATPEDIMVAVNEVTFVINAYMQYFNDLMQEKQLKSSAKKLHIPTS
jgi:hypothetical protein